MGNDLDTSLKKGEKNLEIPKNILTFVKQKSLGWQLVVKPWFPELKKSLRKVWQIEKFFLTL